MSCVDRFLDAFQPLHHPDDYEGTDLGLVTVAHIIQRQGSRVPVASELDYGATLYFTLPGIRATADPGQNPDRL